MDHYRASDIVERNAPFSDMIQEVEPFYPPDDSARAERAAASRKPDLQRERQQCSRRRPRREGSLDVSYLLS
jgi:hypothetical protein